MAPDLGRLRAFAYLGQEAWRLLTWPLRREDAQKLHEAFGGSETCEK